MICIRGEFFTVDGPISDEDEIHKQILDKIKPVLTSGLAKTARNLLNALRIECWSPPLPIQQDLIHFANGTLLLKEYFKSVLSFWLSLCNKPMAYADLILNGDPETYPWRVMDYHPLDT